MKKILIFSLSYYPRFVGGAEVAIKEITDRIDSSDTEFHMVTLRYDSNLPKVEKIGNVLIHRIGFSKSNPEIADFKKFPLHLNKIYFQFGAAIKALSLNKKYKYDAIWAMMAHSCGVPAAIFKIFSPKTPYILTLQEGDPLDYIQNKMRLVYPLFKRAFTSANIVQGISRFLGKWAEDMGYKGDVQVIPNAVDIKRFSQEFSHGELAYIMVKLGKEPDDIYLITTSRLVKKNAVDDVIMSLKFLPNNIKFLILGIGPDHNDLLKLTEEEGVSSRVIFQGQVGHDELPKYLKVSDIFVRPSLSEGMGNSFVEAMAAGRPVIATQEGGISDFLFDPELNKDHKPTGRAVKPRDPKGIAEQVMNYLNDTETTLEIIKNARDLVFEKYDWNIIAKDMKEKVFDKADKIKT